MGNVSGCFSTKGLAFPTLGSNLSSENSGSPYMHTLIYFVCTCAVVYMSCSVCGGPPRTVCRKWLSPLWIQAWHLTKPSLSCSHFVRVSNSPCWSWTPDWSSCLHLQSARITCMYCHAQLPVLFLIHAGPELMANTYTVDEETEIQQWQ